MGVLISRRGVLECLNVRMLECLNVRMLECWNVRMLECWNVRMLECWNGGKVDTIFKMTQRNKIAPH
jgi:hypothetical protein